MAITELGGRLRLGQGRKSSRKIINSFPALAGNFLCSSLSKSEWNGLIRQGMDAMQGLPAGSSPVSSQQHSSKVHSSKANSTKASSEGKKPEPQGPLATKTTREDLPKRITPRQKAFPDQAKQIEKRSLEKTSPGATALTPSEKLSFSPEVERMLKAQPELSPLTHFLYAGQLSAEQQLRLQADQLYQQMSCCVRDGNYQRMYLFSQEIAEFFKNQKGEDKDAAQTITRVKDYTRAKVLGYIKNFDEQSAGNSVVWKYTCNLHTLYSQLSYPEHPKECFEHASRALMEAGSAQVDINKELPAKAMKLMLSTVNTAKDSIETLAFILKVTRAAKGYAELRTFDKHCWQAITSVREEALAFPPPSKDLQLYWDHYKTIAGMIHIGASKKPPETPEEGWNYHTFLGLKECVRHKSGSALWEMGLVKLGIHPLMVDPRLHTESDKKLFDSLLSQSHFQICKQLPQHFPCYSSEEREKLLSIEAQILMGLRPLTQDMATLMGIDRLLGGYLFDQDLKKADAIFNMCPAFARLYQLGKSVAKRHDLNPEVVVKLSRTPGVEKPEDRLISARYLFLAGIQAQEQGKTQMARAYFIGSAIGGFAGGYTRLAQMEKSPDKSRTLTSIAADLGDISAWQLMGDIYAGQGQLKDALICYKQAIQTYEHYGFDEEAEQISDLLEALELEEPLHDKGSSKEKESPDTAKKKRKKKKKGKASTTDTPELVPTKVDIPVLPPVIPPVTVEAASKETEKPLKESLEQSTVLAQSVPELREEPPIPSLPASSMVIQIECEPETTPLTIEPNIKIEATPAITPKLVPHYTGRFANWAEQIMIMSNDAVSIMRGEKLAKDSHCDFECLIEQSGIDDYEKLFRKKNLKHYPGPNFFYSTWLVVRTNMNDDSAELFVNTAGIGKKHAEAHMRSSLEKQFKAGHVDTVEILITRNPCSDPDTGIPGGCWQLITELTKKYPDTQWHVRFIKPNRRHLHPRHITTRPVAVRAFQDKDDSPMIWPAKAKQRSMLQEQVMESLHLSNLNYAVVPTRQPAELKKYYGESGSNKFETEQFESNPHFPIPPQDDPYKEKTSFKESPSL